MSKTTLNFSNGVAPALNGTNMNVLAGGINDANTFYTAGGTANAITITTGNGNYAYADGVIINFKASSDNTGAVTLNVDGQGLKDLRDADGVAFAGGEIESGKFYTFVYDSTAGNFTYAPKGGGIKTTQQGIASFTSGNLTQDVTISSIDITKSIARVSFSVTGSSNSNAIACALINSTTLRLYRVASATTVSVSWVVEEYSNAKSRQEGTKANSGAQTISSIDTAKSVLYASYTSSVASTGAGDFIGSYALTSSTNIQFSSNNNGTLTAYWQVLEF